MVATFYIQKKTVYTHALFYAKEKRICPLIKAMVVWCLCVCFFAGHTFSKMDFYSEYDEFIEQSKKKTKFKMQKKNLVLLFISLNEMPSFFLVTAK